MLFSLIMSHRAGFLVKAALAAVWQHMFLAKERPAATGESDALARGAHELGDGGGSLHTRDMSTDDEDELPREPVEGHGAAATPATNGHARGAGGRTRVAPEPV
jgi:hypothetical protein